MCSGEGGRLGKTPWDTILPNTFTVAPVAPIPNRADVKETLTGPSSRLYGGAGAGKAAFFTITVMNSRPATATAMLASLAFSKGFTIGAISGSSAHAGQVVLRKTVDIPSGATVIYMVSVSGKATGNSVGARPLACGRPMTPID